MAKEPEDIPMEALQHRRILLVDDMDSDRLLLAGFLQRQGCRVLQADNGLDAVQQACAAQPDLILMDVRMPVCDGLDACRTLQSDRRTRHIPLIFLTAASSPEERVQGLLAGAVDYITKPYNLQEVQLRLAVHLRGRTPGGAVASVAAPDSETREGSPASRLDRLLFHSASQLLRDNLGATPDLHQLAASLRTNAKRLNAAFRNCTGSTVFVYLREERMQRSCRLLLDSELSMQAIAGELGFTSGANFATAFRERFGLTPTQFRRERAAAAPRAGETNPPTKRQGDLQQAC